MKAIFVDETKHRGFFLSAVTVDLQDVAMVRKSLSKLRMKGQSTIHFAKESPARRRLILDAVSDPPLSVAYLESQRKQEGDARAECFQRLIGLLESDSSNQLWIETGENYISLDKRIITSALVEYRMVEQVTFQHASPSEQPLLWLPDTLGWARNRGGSWYRRISRLTSQRPISD